jgi:cellulose synthase (UDP-forming)
MNREEKKRNTIFVITILLMTIYLGWRICFTLPLDEGILNVIFAILLILAEGVTVFTTFELFIHKMRVDSLKLERPDVPGEYLPHVDVFIATHNEPVGLLYKTVNACTFMDYPDKSKVHIYLCDDGDRSEVEDLAREFGIGYLGFSGNTQAKSGNLNHAMSKTSSPYIATFDADMIPQHTFLMKTVPYFLLSKFIKENGVWRLRNEEELKEAVRLGLIQTTQSFYNPDLFQFNLYAEQNIPNEQDFFSKEVNVMRNSSNAVAYTGSNTVILRKAIDEIGGFPLKTITEDFETSIRLQKAGYITFATDEIQAAGLTTTTIKSMLKQRVRWARGIIQSIQNTHAVTTKDLPIKARITYLCSFLYWWSFFFRLIFILSPILFALFDFKIVNTQFWEVVLFWLPAYFSYSIAMRYLSGNIRNQRWSQVIDTIFMPYLIVPVLLETLHIHEKKFKVTNKRKDGDSTGFNLMVFALPHILLLAMSIAAMFRFVQGKYGWALFYSSIIVFWIAHNMVALCYAIFFMSGRRVYRNSERIKAEEKVLIEYKNLHYEVRTIDVSENGIAIWSQHPIYLPDKENIRFTIRTPFYKARLKGQIVYVKEQNEGWQYSADIKPIDEQNKQQYMQIIYDRTHTLPKQMNLWITAYDDILRNIKKRIGKSFSEKQRRPQIRLDKQITFADGGTCRLLSFCYSHLSVSNLIAGGKNDDFITYYTESGIKLVLKRTGEYIERSTEELMTVMNIDELVDKNQINRIYYDLTNTEEGEKRHDDFAIAYSDGSSAPLLHDRLHDVYQR